MYSWSRNSKKHINTVNDIGQLFANRLILVTPFDIGVLNTGGLRTAEMQHDIFIAKHSKCDGYEKKSYHQSGLAIDFVPYINGGFTWTNGFAFLSIAKKALKVWSGIVQEGLDQDYYLHWGGYWGDKDLDNDNLLEITDQLGWDMAHFCFRRKPQKNQLRISV